MAFYGNPGKWVAGSHIKIGYFVTDSDLKFQDEVHGSLIEQVDKTVDLVYQKYMKGLIYYEGIQRIDKFMFPKDAFREILLNAVVHKNYSTCNPIQISVYEDKIYIWNDGIMPKELSSTEKLFEKHSSRPFNPRLAGVFFKSGMIEAWGRSFDKIKEVCTLHNTPLPEYDIQSTGIMVLCKPNEKYMDLLRGRNAEADNDKEFVDKYVDEFVNKCVESEVQKSILRLIQKQPTISAKTIAGSIGMSPRGVQKNIDSLKRLGILERVGPAKGGQWVVKSSQ